MVYLQKPSACSDETCATGCSAILIDENHLITAAHCIGTTDPANITVIAGAHSLSSTMETATRQIRTVQQIFLHPQYNFSATDNDIAVLRVNISFIFTKYIQPACLPDDEAQFNEDVVTIGWGSISLNDTKNKILKQIYTTVVNNCNLYWPHVNNTQQLCVHDSISSHLVCHDNGSGAILVLHKGQFVIEGLASYVKECHAIGNRFKPHVYTRVSAYKTWINEIIE
jgi:secreted trypsin-like serine protease